MEYLTQSAEVLAGLSIRATHELLMDSERAKSALRSLLDGIDEYCALISADLKLLWANQSFAKVLGLEWHTVYKAQLSSYWNDQDCESLCKLLQNSHATLSAEALLLSLKTQNQSQEILWTARPYSALSARRGPIFVLSGRDVSALIKETQAKSALASQLDTARKVQSLFVHAETRELKNLKVYPFFSAAESCSGDFWGHFSLSPTQDLICVADAMGHGVSAAIVTSIVHAALKGMLAVYKEAHQSPSLEALLKHLDLQLSETLDQKISLSCFLACFDHEKAELSYANAGHHFPYMSTRAGIKDERLQPFRSSLRTQGKESASTLLPAPSSPLGLRTDQVFRTQRWALKSGDRLCLYTDGILESRNTAGRPYGRRLFHRSFEEGHSLSAQAALNHMVTQAKTFYGTEAPDDDLTLVICEWL